MEMNQLDLKTNDEIPLEFLKYLAFIPKKCLINENNKNDIKLQLINYSKYLLKPQHTFIIVNYDSNDDVINNKKIFALYQGNEINSKLIDYINNIFEMNQNIIQLNIMEYIFSVDRVVYVCSYDDHS